MSRLKSVPWTAVHLCSGWQGRDSVGKEDILRAIQLVILPRSSISDQQQEEPPPNQPPPPPPPPQNEQEQQEEPEKEEEEDEDKEEEPPEEDEEVNVVHLMDGRPVQMASLLMSCCVCIS